MAKLHFYYAAMNAGKSTNLLQSNYNYHERGMDTLLFAPIIDTRYKSKQITSRLGIMAEAIAFEDNTNLFQIVERELELNDNLSCIFVDEAHFLKKEQVRQLTMIVDKLKIPVLAYGLRSDHQAEPFEGSLYLLTWADELIEVKTICHCGRKATMNMRIDDKGNRVAIGDQIQIGGNELYRSTCRHHFFLGDSGVNKINAYKAKSIEREIDSA